MKFESAGEFIRYNRIKNKILAKDLASKLGISQSYYSDIERERREPYSRVFYWKISNIFKLDDVDYSYLLLLANLAPVAGVSGISYEKAKRKIQAYLETK